MGEVYLALDTRLGRHVAIKFLPPHLTVDETILRRFQQEARTASVLNHPNILTIFDMGQQAGEHFIVSEFIEGVTLRAALRTQKPDLKTTINYTKQIASALRAAHGAGVVHRDLKPANVMIRSDGYVKVIDFGLAKLAEPFRKQVGRAVGAGAAGGSWTEETITRPGMMVGTVHYMSPEQARGLDVDERSDLWSLGVILYEMLSLQRPFDGDTESHVVVRILDGPVPLIDQSSGVPLVLSAILNKALIKDRNKRYQNSDELLRDLEEAERSLNLISVTATPTPVRVSSNDTERSRPRFLARSKWAGISAIALVLIAIGIWWGIDGQERFLEPNWFVPVNPRQITFNESVQIATISPDGRYVAYATGEPDNNIQALRLRSLDRVGGAETKIPASRIRYLGITFAPDSQSMYAVEKGADDIGRLYQVPTIGDPRPQPIVKDIDGPVSFSPDGSRFAYVRYVPEPGGRASSTQIIVSRSDGSEPRVLLQAKTTLSRYLSWSPDGKYVTSFQYASAESGVTGTRVDFVSEAGRERSRQLAGWRTISSPPAWLPDGKSFLVTAATQAQGVNEAQVYGVGSRFRAVHQLTQDTDGYKSVSLTPDGTKLCAIQMRWNGTIWISKALDFTEGKPISSEAIVEKQTLDWLDDNHVISQSRRGGFTNLWSIDIRTGVLGRVTDEANVERSVAKIPGRNEIVFSSNRSGEFKLWQLNLDTNVLLQLTHGETIDDQPECTPDGAYVVYTSWMFDMPRIRKLRLTSSSKPREDKVLSDLPSRSPHVSPDGKWITCEIFDRSTGKWRRVLLPVDGGPVTRYLADEMREVSWTPDGRSFAYLAADDRAVDNVWTVPIMGGAPKQLTKFFEGNVLKFAWSPSGNKLACLRGSMQSDIVAYSRKTKVDGELQDIRRR